MQNYHKLTIYVELNIHVLNEKNVGRVNRISKLVPKLKLPNGTQVL